MSDHPPHDILDRPWRIWASVTVIAILLLGVALGVLIIPVVQDRGAGLDAYTAICRSLGILPGSPAQRQPSSIYYAGQPKRTPALVGGPELIVRLVELGDPNRNIPPCMACHRAASGGPIETPILNDQGHDYLVRQLQAFASGQRRNDVYGRMRLIAAKLTATEIKGSRATTRQGKTDENFPLTGSARPLAAD